MGGQRRVGLVRNALDFSTDFERLEAGREREFDALRNLGLHPEEVDLRAYFGAQNSLRALIHQLDALWVVGGNTFLLRRAMKQSGLDTALLELGNDAFVYAGYSAGACVVTPSLKGVHLADEPETVPEGYSREVIWDGLGLVPFCIVPHCRSDHPESERCEAVAGYYLEHKVPFVALRDGEVCIR